MTTGMQSTSRVQFEQAVAAIAAAIADRPLDARLGDWLNATYPVSGQEYRHLAALIERGSEEGWLCKHAEGGIRFGRVIKPGGVTGRFSVDVVHMEAVRGPHHVHPQGEIGMIVPTSCEPNFDGFGAGWYVYGPGSDHWPTVTDGSAFVLYLLPDGAIEFTGR